MDIGLKCFLVESKNLSVGIILGLGLLMVSAMVADAGSDRVLPPCPSSPNCVSSQSLGNHYVEPFAQTGAAITAFENLKQIFANRKDTTIVSAKEGVIAVEFRTSLGFVDDGLFVLDPGGKEIHVRSSSRLGYWDLGKNRRRVEEIRREFRKRMEK